MANSGRCVCGKITYSSQRAARLANRSVGFRLREYRCSIGNHSGWHVSAAEKKGLLKKDKPMCGIEE